jgi:hypothetical protein
MSDLDPHPTSFAAELVDPAITRLLARHPSGPAASLLHRAGPIATSVTFVVPEDARVGAGFAEGLRAWKPDTVRVEVLAVAGYQDRRPPVPAGPGSPVVPLRPLRRPLGGRAAVLAEAAEQAACEFVVITSSDDVPFESLVAAMGHMWAEGCDAALVDPSTGQAEPPSGDPRGAVSGADAAARLANWLGPAGPAGRVVVLRRWVARWLFNEVTRAIDPWEEIADRTRLLGICILHLHSEPERS